MSKHTREPWNVRKMGPHIDDVFVEGGSLFPDRNHPFTGRPVGHEILADDYNGAPEGQKFADACLVSAAPDLLAAAKFAKAILNAKGGMMASERDDATARLMAAIAKAEGRS